jgi:Carboxypeptidase regulatory-like domain/TonB dependent receptor
MHRTYLFLAGMVFLFITLLGGRAFAQGGATGAISGVVVDSSGGTIADAEVQIIDAQTDQIARKVPTGSDGSFVITLLPPGTYTVVVNKSGFAEAKSARIEVRVTETTRITIPLKPGAVSDTVEITAQITTVDTTNPTTGQSITSSTVRTLPLATQNFQQLLSLSSGAQSELNSSTQLGRGNVRIEVNGQREDNNNYLIEGISATDYNVAELTNTPLPNADVIQEFKVQTSLYDASQGRNGGGNINAVLKSGSRTIHGDVYEFFRNDKLDANDFFLNAAGEGRPIVQQNIFGGSLGAPVGTEKLGFFFINYQGTRQKSGDSPGTFIATSIPYIPASARVSAAALEAYCGIPSVDPVALALLQAQSSQFGGAAGGFLFPIASSANGANCITPGSFVTSKPGIYNDDQFTANWDKEFNSGVDKISARTFYSNSQSFLPFGAGGLQASLGAAAASTDLNFPYLLPLRGRFFSIAETHLFSPTLVNEFRFGFNHINNSGINQDPITASDVGIDRPTNNLTDSIYKFTLESSGFQFGPTPASNQSQTQNNYTFLDTVSWVHGSHVVRIGGEVDFVNLDKLFPQVFNGQLFFTDTGAGGGPIGASTTDFQNFLLGAPQFSFGGGGVYNHQYKQNDFAAFAQDDWKATKNLTLNLGLRTEILGAWNDGDCHIGNVDSALTYSGTNPYIFPGCVDTLGVPGLTGAGPGTTFLNNYSTGLGPRIGLAYDLFGKHTTTIRAGYGIYYVREDVGAVDQMSFNAPFLPIAFGGGGVDSLGSFFAGSPATNPNALPPAGVLSSAYLPCLSVLQGFPGGDTTQAGNYANQAGCNGVGTINLFTLELPRHFKVPNTQQWNLTIQHSLGHQWVLEVGYVGTHGVHLRDTRDAIQSLDATAADPVVVKDVNGNTYDITTDTFDNGPARTPTPGLNGYSGYQIFANDAWSRYNSLQSTISRRWSQGYFQAAYTWSKAIDATSTGNTAFNTAYNSQTDVNASKGLSDFDRTHRLVISYVYDLPFLHNSTGFVHAALAGWQVGGITTLQSGLPFSIYDSEAGTAFLGAGSTPALGASLASGATIASGYATGSLNSRVSPTGSYLNAAAFTPAPFLYPTDPANPATTCDPINNPNFCTTGFGDLQRNAYRGPFEQNWDFSLIKNFHITERQNLRFTADLFNIWNHPNFANPAVTDVETASLPNSPFGRIVSTNGQPRLIQFSLRYSF